MYVWGDIYVKMYMSKMNYNETVYECVCNQVCINRYLYLYWTCVLYYNYILLL